MSVFKLNYNYGISDRSDRSKLSAWKIKKSQISAVSSNLDTLTLDKNTYGYLIVEKFSSKL